MHLVTTYPSYRVHAWLNHTGGSCHAFNVITNHFGCDLNATKGTTGIVWFQVCCFTIVSSNLHNNQVCDWTIYQGVFWHLDQPKCKSKSLSKWSNQIFSSIEHLSHQLTFMSNQIMGWSGILKSLCHFLLRVWWQAMHDSKGLPCQLDNNC